MKPGRYIALSSPDSQTDLVTRHLAVPWTFLPMGIITCLGKMKKLTTPVTTSLFRLASSKQLWILLFYPFTALALWLPLIPLSVFLYPLVKKREVACGIQAYSS